MIYSSVAILIYWYHVPSIETVSNCVAASEGICPLPMPSTLPNKQ